jgi:hypothetical protein
MNAVERIDEALKAAGIPIYGVSPDNDSGWTVDFAPAATQTQRDAAPGIIAGLDLTPGGLATRDNAREQERAVADLTSGSDKLDKLIRGVLLVALDEINVIREWLVSFKAEVAAATNLANLQTRVATLPNMPDRTAAQLKTAVGNKISAGAAD